MPDKSVPSFDKLMSGVNASKTIEGTYHMPNSNVFGGRLGDGGKSCPKYGGAGGAGFVGNGEDGFSSGHQVFRTSNFILRQNAN